MPTEATAHEPQNAQSQEQSRPATTDAAAPTHPLDDCPINDSIPQVYFYKQIFKPEECERVLAAQTDPQLTREFLAQQRRWVPGFAQYMQAESAVLAPVPENQWIFDYCHKLMHVLNDRHYKFDVEALFGAQIVTLKEGMSIDMHMDLGNGPFAQRKMSLVVFLSPDQDYEGGAYDLMTTGVYSKRRHQGTVAISPAYFVSGFEAVRSGELKVLMAWLHGKDRFR